MTSFNAVGAILPLDEYWKNCVNPKPLIPPSYPGARFYLHRQAGSTQEGQGQAEQAVPRKTGHRQAGNVRSYKDGPESDDDDDELVGTGESVEDSPDGSDNDFKSNASQINYEMDDFNKTYCDESSPWQNESSNSVQGEGRHNANTTGQRPNVGQKNNVKSRLDLNFKNRRNKRNGWQRGRYNNGNQNQNRGQQQQQQARFLLQQRMRFAYNSFKDNNMDQSPNVLMNHKHNLQNTPQNPPEVGYPSSVTSMIDSVANLADSRAYNRPYVCYETTTAGLSLNNSHFAAERAQVNALPELENPMELGSSATVQQVARHVMLMMKTVGNIDTQETPEYFKSKK